MRPTAGLRLKKLLTDHQVKVGGTALEDCYDGIAMFKELEALEKEDVGEYDLKRFRYAYEKMRDKKLPENCTPQVFATRANVFLRDVNPYLEVPLEGARLSKFFIDLLPGPLSSDARQLKRAVKADSSIDDPDKVLAQCKEIVEGAYEPNKRSGIDIDLVALIAGDILVGEPKAERKPADHDSTEGSVSKAEVAKLVAAAVASAQRKFTRSTESGGKGGAGAGRGTRNGGKPPRSLLPDGKWCNSGTCNFNHDDLRPGERCYRDPDYEGPLPLRTWNDAKQMVRILADREACGKRLGKTVKQLKPPGGGAATPPISASLADRLMDMYVLDEDTDDDDDDDDRISTNCTPFGGHL